MNYVDVNKRGPFSPWTMDSSPQSTKHVFRSNLPKPYWIFAIKDHNLCFLAFLLFIIILFYFSIIIFCGCIFLMNIGFENLKCHKTWPQDVIWTCAQSWPRLWKVFFSLPFFFTIFFHFVFILPWCINTLWKTFQYAFII